MASRASGTVLVGRSRGAGRGRRLARRRPSPRRIEALDRDVARGEGDAMGARAARARWWSRAAERGEAVACHGAC
jgi:hypothetical protein